MVSQGMVGQTRARKVSCGGLTCWVGCGVVQEVCVGSRARLCPYLCRSSGLDAESLGCLACNMHHHLPACPGIGPSSPCCCLFILLVLCSVITNAHTHNAGSGCDSQHDQGGKDCRTCCAAGGAARNRCEQLASMHAGSSDTHWAHHNTAQHNMRAWGGLDCMSWQGGQGDACRCVCAKGLSVSMHGCVPRKAPQYCLLVMPLRTFLVVTL